MENMKVFLLITRKMVKVNIDGLMVKFMMVSGKMVRNMVVVYGGELEGTHTLENGNSAKLMALVCIYGLMETGTRENSKII